MGTPHLQKFTAIILPCEKGGVTSACLEVNGAVSQGETEEEAFENLKEATSGLLELNAELKAEQEARKKAHLLAAKSRRKRRSEFLKLVNQKGRPACQKSFELHIA